MQIVTIERVVRRMRGGSQSFTVLGDDGQFYVAKFQGNPQGTRTLVNEWIGSNLLTRLGITTPKVRILRLLDRVDGEDLFFSTPDGRRKIFAGLHLGSLCPVNPDRVAIYDLLPATVIEKLLVNGSDFAKAYIFDCWAGHADRRQAIFFRNPNRKGFVAGVIDNGMLFGGRHWKLFTAPAVCLYCDRTVYRALDLRRLALDTIEVIRSWTLSDIDEIVTAIPDEWFEGDKDAFWRMAEKLIARSATVDTQSWLTLLKSYAYSHVKRKAAMSGR